jgi:hypothetical protein
MGSGSSETVEPKNIDDMLADLKKAAKRDGYDLKGDKKSGKGAAKESAPTVEYAVKNKEVTVTVTTGSDLYTMEQLLKKWLKPYKK